MQAERQRRWYLGLSEEQRDARRRLDRERKRTKYDPERERERNSLRIYAGATYMGRAKTVEQAQEIQEEVSDRLAKFLARQRAERRASRIIEEALDQRNDGLLRVVFQSRKCRALVRMALDGTEHERAAARKKLLDPKVRRKDKASSAAPEPVERVVLLLGP